MPKKPKCNRAVARGRRRAPQFDAILTEHASAIRAISRAFSHRATEDAIEIGRHLADAKEHAGHGHWLKWLRAELGWSPGTAGNLIRVYRSFGDGKFVTVTNLPLGALYELARKSTPDEVRDQIVSRAKAGEAITRQVVVSVTRSKRKVILPPAGPVSVTHSNIAPYYTSQSEPKTIAEWTRDSKTQREISENLRDIAFVITRIKALGEIVRDRFATARDVASVIEHMSANDFERMDDIIAFVALFREARGDHAPKERPPEMPADDDGDVRLLPGPPKRTH